MNKKRILTWVLWFFGLSLILTTIFGLTQSSGYVIHLWKEGAKIFWVILEILIVFISGTIAESEI